jgi:protein associated with RNAse G/E
MAEILVQSYKYPGVKHYSYPARLLAETSDLVIIYGPWERPLTHPGKGLVNVPIPNQSIEFHFLHRPYNVAAAFDEAGRLRCYYCNVATPATFQPPLLSATDLDLDLVVRPDLTYTVEDEDEFLAHQAAYGYPPELVALAREGLAELIRLVESRSFPFDGAAETWLKGLTANRASL